MSRTNIILLVVIVITLIGGGVGLYFVVSPKTPTTPKAAQNTADLNQINIKEKVTADKTYEDTAGFSFKYPNQFAVSDITPETNTYYSKLRLTGKSGDIILTAVDTTYKTLSEWQNLNKDATLVGASLLGDVKANQYKKGSQLMTVAVDQGVLYTVENTSDSGLLDESHSVVSSSFKFSDQQTTTTSSPQTGGDVEYEEEEVVE